MEGQNVLSGLMSTPGLAPPVYFAVLAFVAVSLNGCGSSSDSGGSHGTPSATTKTTTTTVYNPEISIALGYSSDYTEGDDKTPQNMGFDTAQILGQEDHACNLKDSTIITEVDPSKNNCTGNWVVTILCHPNQPEVIPVRGGIHWPVNMSNGKTFIRAMNDTFNCNRFGLHFNLTFGKKDNCGILFQGDFHGHCNKPNKTMLMEDLGTVVI